ncbi:LTA synthase family protein [Entomomonas asaccharolytica]|uniref:LTA synthase family protein n=1 Tax=Entomomonas asaccharolytica TaxID=2785331 RepID=A0A974NER5_9GAMM|nr:LTA synthase family protein [Entomomonas asaccharolytica]QQP85164.1 LTA synthase family protein [Entomomonas asaccharolytica]
MKQNKSLGTPSALQQLGFFVLSALVLMIVYSLLRYALFQYNHELVGDTPTSTFIEAFINGLRFDGKMVAFMMIPIGLTFLCRPVMGWRFVQRLWLTIAACIAIFLGVLELDFYHEFHQRLNSLVFQYIREDPKTVLSMIWYGYPVVKYMLAWAIITAIIWFIFKLIDRITRSEQSKKYPFYVHLIIFVICAAVITLVGRGTLRQGSPLRWGDAYTTDSPFANQLGLNGTLSLIDAARNVRSRNTIWKATMPPEQAQQIVRTMLLTPSDTLVEANKAVIRRDYQPNAEKTLPIKNVVVILMESFAGRYTGVLGDPNHITPNFDKLAQEGLLFTQFFSNGTHTHQGMFATMACFPNLPAFETLMQEPEGNNKFSGLPQLLSIRDMNDVYVYNGDFAWDNQSGFFSNQGMTTFIGRNDYVNPVFSDPTWGVSDQDMFARGNEELDKLAKQGKPFYALLQSLSNHTPYALPKNLPVEPVTDQGSQNEHLTAMRYSDWALGQFFEKAKQSPYYNDTLFVIVGDHGFGSPMQLTDMDMFRFNVPLLLIAPGVQEKFGKTNTTVGTQVDVVPTIMGRLGGDVRHQCWGRDLLNLPEGDKGFGIIKPSGSDQTVALIKGNEILIRPSEMEPKLYHYQLGAKPSATLLNDQQLLNSLKPELEAYIQMATQSLLENTAGAEAAQSDK